MKQTIRAALPGYDVLTDKNLDHFSLYADVDNVLIKRFQKKTDSVAAAGGSGYTTNTYPHNLGYIPFFATFSDILGDGTWRIVNNQYNAFSLPEVITAIDVSNLSVTNFTGSSKNLAYDIFYDDMSLVGVPKISESGQVIKLARPGKSVFSKNPNDYIMHSDLNNFKILKQGKKSLTLSGGGTFSPDSFAHEAKVISPYKMFCFMKFPDGKTAILGGDAITLSYDASNTIYGCYFDGTSIYIASPSTPAVSIYYLVYGTGKSGTILKSPTVLACTSKGHDVFTETNPDNFNFHSSYPTLKYFTSGSYTMSGISDTTVQTIPHNLGYVPFFIGFVNDFAINFYTSESYAILPYYWGRSTIGSPNRDIAAFIYADETNIYLKAWYDTNAVGTVETFKFYYKIFKNNIGL